MQKVVTNMKPGNRAIDVKVNNTRINRTSVIKIAKDVHTFQKKKGLEYTFFLEEHKHALARAK